MVAGKQIKKPSLAWPIINFVITILLFVVFNDSLDQNWYLLVFFLGTDVLSLVQYFQRKKAYERIEQMAETQSAESVGQQALGVPARITVSRERSAIGSAVAYKVYCNGAFMGDVKNGKQRSFDTTVAHNTVTFFDTYGNPFKDEVVSDVQAGGGVGIFVKAGKVLVEKTHAMTVPAPGAQAVDAPIAVQAASEQAQVAVALPEQATRAYWLMGGALLFMLISAFVTTRNQLRFYETTNELLVLANALVVGACVYLATRTNTKGRILALCGLLASAAVYTVCVSYLRRFAMLWNAPDIRVLFRFPEFSANLRGALTTAGIVGAVVIISMIAYKDRIREKLGQTAWISVAALIVWRLFNLRRMFTLPNYTVLHKIGYAVSAIDTAVCIALFALLIYMLCNPKGAALRTGTGTKVWFCICILFTSGSVVVSLVTETMGVASAAVAIVGVVGYILMLMSRRAGFPILLMAVLMSVVAGINAGLMTGRPSLAVSLSSLVGLVNPFITWLVIRNAWQDVSVPSGYAVMPAQEVEKPAVHVVFKIAAIVNIAVGSMLFLAAAYVMLQLARFVMEPFVFGVVLGGVLIGLGLVAAMQCFGSKRRPRRWFLILQLVIACLALVVTIAGFATSMS